VRVEKPSLFKPSVPRYLKAEISASELVKRVGEVLGGSGGGKPEIAQGGGEKIEGFSDRIIPSSFCCGLSYMCPLSSRYLTDGVIHCLA